MPVAEVATVRRGTAISAVYGTARIEPAFVVHVRAQNSGFIQLAEPFSAGRGAIGKSVEKGQLLATIADETTARQLKQARADLDAAVQRAELALPSSELLKAAEDNLQRLEKVVSSGNVPMVEYEKAKSEAKRLRGVVETERIERDRNLNALGEAAKKLEAQMKSAEVQSPIDGLLTNVQTIDGELVSDGNELFTVSSRKNYVRGEVNEEDVGEVKPGMKAKAAIVCLSNSDFHRERYIHPASGRPDDAAVYHRAGDGKSSRQFDGRYDWRNEHYHRHTSKRSARANTRAHCRSSSWWSNEALCACARSRLDFGPSILPKRSAVSPKAIASLFPTRTNCGPGSQCGNEWSACRRCRRNHDAAALHCAAFFDAPQTGLAPQS